MEVGVISLLSRNELGWWDEQWGRPILPPSDISSWDLKWHEQWGGPTLPPIGHQQLKVEVTWAMRRTCPIPLLAISSWQLKLHEQWGGLIHPQPSVFETWNDMSNEEDPSPPLLVISSWELKWHEQFYKGSILSAQHLFIFLTDLAKWPTQCM